MSQRIISPPSNPKNRGFYGWLTSIVKTYALCISHWEPIYLLSSAAEHRRRPGCFETFGNLGHGIRIVFGLTIAALLCSPLSAGAVGQTKIVSLASNGAYGNDQSDGASISADGRYVAFESNADNLVPGDTNGFPDVFVHDRVDRKTSRISLYSDGTQANFGGYFPAISADGRYVTFISQSNLMVPGDNTTEFQQVFVYDRKIGTTSLVSIASDGTKGNSGSNVPEISADGRFVAFWSYSNNLVPRDSNEAIDVFVHDRKTGKTTRVSVASDGTQGNDSSYSGIAISADGRYVVFRSDADNLVPGDTNGLSDIFIHNLSNGKTSRISIASDGTQGNGSSQEPVISSNGRYVAFSSAADNLVPGDTNRNTDVFVHDQLSGQTTRVSLTPNGTLGFNGGGYPKISADGRYVTFSSGLGLYYNFLHDRKTGQTTLVSLASNGAQANSDPSYIQDISANGRYLAFASYSSSIVSGDTNGNWDVFVRDRLLLPNKKADLSVTQSKSGNPIIKGSQFTYTVKVKNNGLDPASDVNLTDLVPLEEQLLSVIPSQGSCYKAPITVCRLGSLAAGAGAQVQVKLKAIRSGVIRNTVSVNAAPKDLAPNNNTSTISTLVK